MRTILALGFCAVLGTLMFASQDTQPQKSNPKPLTNQDVVDMLKVGLSQEIVIAKINASTCEFDTSPATLKALKAANIPDGVILAMVQAPGLASTRTVRAENGKLGLAEATIRRAISVMDEIGDLSDYEKSGYLSTLASIPASRVPRCVTVRSDSLRKPNSKMTMTDDGDQANLIKCRGRANTISLHLYFNPAQEEKAGCLASRPVNAEESDVGRHVGFGLRENTAKTVERALRISGLGRTADRGTEAPRPLNASIYGT